MGRECCSKLASLLLSSLEEMVRADSRLLLSSEASFGMADGNRGFVLDPVSVALLEYIGAAFGEMRLLAVVVFDAVVDDELFT